MIDPPEQPSHKDVIFHFAKKQGAQIMTFIDEKKEEATEETIYEKGGYPALWKYKAWKTYEKFMGGECCNAVKGACGNRATTDRKSGNQAAVDESREGCNACAF